MRRILTWAAAAMVAAAAPAGAETLTKETEKLLKDLKLTPAILDGLDKELAVPPAWIEAAKKEGTVKVRMTLTDPEFSDLKPVFEARYPFVTLEYQRGVGRERAIGPLLAAKRGQVLSDVLFAFDSNEQDFREAKALADLRDLPGFGNVPEEVTAPDGTWVGAHGPHYCLSYNLNSVKKAELPKTWEELISNPRWRNGKVGMTVNFHSWLTPLGSVLGEAWLTDYMERLFTVLKPQLRKENLSMTPRLNAIGEYDLSVPAGDYAVWPYQDQGMPVGFHCPDLVAKGNSSFGVLAASPRLHAAKLFVNWAISKEGQLALVRAGQILPQHKALQIREVMPYPDEVLGKKMAGTTAKVRVLSPKYAEKWHELWTGGGGPDLGRN